MTFLKSILLAVLMLALLPVSTTYAREYRAPAVHIQVDRLGGSPLLAKQFGVGSRSFHVPSSAPSCVDPTTIETYEWPMYGTGVTCTPTSACTNSANIANVPSIVSPNNATPYGTANYPIYTTSTFGTLAGANLGSPSISALYLQYPIPAANTTYSMWWTFKLASGGGGALNGGTIGNAFEWRVYPTGQQMALDSGSYEIGQGSYTFAAGTAYTVAATINTTTGAWALYTLSGGVATLDGSGTVTPFTFANPMDTIGASYDNTDPFSGYILDGGYYDGIWTSTQLTAIAAYSKCKAGV
jgi:hypothetical protein